VQELKRNDGHLCLLRLYVSWIFETIDRRLLEHDVRIHTQIV